MKYAIEAHGPRLSPEEFARFIGSPEHLRRARKHGESLAAAVAERFTQRGQQSILVSVGMGPPDETFTLYKHGDEIEILDGPFAETKEYMGGFNLIDFPSQAEALRFAENEHLREFEHVQVVRPLERMWWSNHFRAMTAADFGAFVEPRIEPKLFMLVRFSNPPSPEQRALIADRFERVGAEYLRRGTVSNQAVAWCGGSFGDVAEQCAIRINSAAVERIEVPRGREGKQVTAFVITACRSADEAREWAAKLSISDDDVIEIRTVNGFWWTYRE